MHRVRVGLIGLAWVFLLVMLATTFLRDPDRVLPFKLNLEATAERYLTGADLDPESIQPIGDLLWIGDEFGPYLVAVD